jgi:hypothetical protein
MGRVGKLIAKAICLCIFSHSALSEEIHLDNCAIKIPEGLVAQVSGKSYVRTAVGSVFQRIYTVQGTGAEDCINDDSVVCQRVGYSGQVSLVFISTHVEDNYVHLYRVVGDKDSVVIAGFELTSVLSMLRDCGF